jgi:plasmid stability protein
MNGVATLYVRNVPAALYAELQRWAAESGRSVNAEVLALLEREADERRFQDGWFERVLALRRKIGLSPDAPTPEDLIREDRDRGHKPELGY